jgi:acyl transferase domain-containing protein/NAD(P)-dependent dehydrogenase (short-subunit alcohol dehydrogenase family)/acyl carrier protein
MACRLPKGLDTTDDLWNALCNRFSAIDTIPPDRWTADRYYFAQDAAKGKAYIRRGGFLSHDIAGFDAGFFGISPRDAENMDPQQRLMLEVVWEAFENAGFDLPAHAGQRVGVYVGGFMLDHMINQMAAANRTQINQHTAAGMMMTMLSNRVSHTFDFRGPSLSIDTACSSSLVAFHYACQDLWNGAARLAVVGGASVMLRPETPVGMCKGRFLSRDGECKSFDERGDGYGRGEGAGAVLLKPLGDALAAGDQVLATVIGTGTNQDGRTPGISMPSFEAQKALIEEICRDYAIDPRDVRYVECHGTGTAVGDPIEARAIGETYGVARRGLSPVVIGSVKSNIGHLEAAAGVAGVIKAVLTMMHREAAPLANLKQPNPAIAVEALNLRLADARIPLAGRDEPFCVAINSFGYGGSNAHIVLRTPPSKPVPSVNGNGRHHRLPYLLPLSGRSDKGVAALAGRYAELLRGPVALDDLLYTASLKRAHLSHRAVVKGNDRAELIAALETLARGEESDNIVRGVQPHTEQPRPVLVFTGMGPQWWGMGQQLYREDAIYRQTVERADRAWQTIAGFSILAEMLKGEADSQITKTELAQPANLFIQLGVLAMLEAAGVKPGAVVGHSVGELGSAYAAGVLDLEDALKVCYHRSRLQATCAGTGAMMAVGLSVEKAEKLLAEGADRVSIAAVNGPANVTLAGDAAQLAALAQQLARDEIFHRKLDVEVPYHSPMMDPIMGPLAEALADIRPRAPRIPLYSTVTGRLVQSVSYGADYWPLNARQAVLFAPAVRELLDAGFTTFLEVGPHPVLATSLKDVIKSAGRDCRTVFTLRRQNPELSSVHRGIMGVYAVGSELDWQLTNGHGKFIALPNYPWQRERLWMETERARQDRIMAIVHPILGMQDTPGAPVWRNDFEHQPVAYLQDHVVAGTPILPAAGFIEALLELATLQFEHAAGFTLRSLDIHAPMVIAYDKGVDSVTAYDPASQSATIRSLESGRLGAGQVHVVGRLGSLGFWQPRSLDLDALRQDWRVVEPEVFYTSLDQMGLQYGPAFRTVRQMHVSPAGGRSLARIEMDPNLTANLSQYVAHPTLLDACFQSMIGSFENSDTTFLPTGFAELCLYGRQLPAAIWCLAEMTRQSARHLEFDLTLTDDAGKVLAVIRGMRLTAAAKRHRVDRFGDRVKKQVLRYEWTYGETLSEAKRLGYWLIVGGSADLADEVARRLENYGASVAFRAWMGDEFEQGFGTATVRPGSAEDADAVLAACGDLHGVVFLHGLTATPDSNDPTGETAVAGLIGFSQAMCRYSEERRPRVYVVTQRAFAATEHDPAVHPAQTAMGGYNRVAFNELEGFRFSTVDLPAEIDEPALDALALELLCDDIHDEVALRHGLRLVSELKESRVLSDDRIAYQRLDDEHPVRVRPLRDDVESVGTARILAISPPVIGPRDLCVRVEATIISTSLLEPDSESQGHPCVEMVGRVMAKGAEVRDLQVGQRVCGFAPVDVASHITADRRLFQIVEAAAELPIAPLLGTLGLATRAELAIEHLELTESDTALVQVSPLGIVLAEALRRRGADVALLCDDPTSFDPQLAAGFPVYSCCPEGMARAAAERTAGVGFSVLAVGMHAWLKSFDQRVVRTGGAIIDTDDTATRIVAAPHVHDVIRTDLRVLLEKPRRVERALARVVRGLVDGTLAPSPAFDVSIADLAWRKLPMADKRGTLVLTYETRGQDLPVVLPDNLKFRPDATYLITGGFGGLGFKTAQWLVEHGAKHLVLTGRTGADTPERQALADLLAEQGATVWAAACDTSDPVRLGQVIAEIESTMPPLRGVFHSAAVILDQPIADMDQPTYQRVMRSKALGAWNLHEATRSLELDHFVLYSSAAYQVGNSRQSAYCAANGFLCGLAEHRRALGLAATAIHWGALADVGVVTKDDKLEQFLRYTGLRSIGSAEGLEVLRQALGRGVTEFCITLISSWSDWARFETRGSTSPRFATLIAGDSQGKDHSARDLLVEELAKVDPLDRLELLAGLIVEVIASVLKSDAAGVPVDRPINQLGVDSLMATEIQSLLDSKLGISISILELIGDTTIRKLAALAETQLCGNATPLAVAPAG